MKLKHLIVVVAYYIGLIQLFYLINRKKQRVLVYHNIIPDGLLNGSFEQKIVCTPESFFQKQMEVISKRFTLTTKIGVPNTAVITFDDGYRSALIAKKILDRYDAKAYFFVPLSIVDKGPLWIDKVMAWFAYVPSGIYQVEGVEINLNSNDSRAKVFSGVIDKLYKKGNYSYNDVIYELDNNFSFRNLKIPEDYQRYRFFGLSKKEIEQLQHEGYLIGGHSIRHDILSMLSESELKEDFNNCSAQIGCLFNSRVYAYPFGHKRDVSPKCIEICAQSDFIVAFMNEYVNNPSKYTLSRLNISSYKSIYEIEAALSGFTPFLKRILRQINIL